LLSSLINFSAVSNIQEDPAGPALSFGIILFCFSFCVLLTDRCGGNSRIPLLSSLNYTKAWDGRLEGYCLVVVTLYAATAVAYITQVGGIAYLALNVYFTAWLMLASCLHTLNQYSAAKDILSFQEMTSVSATLKSWYVVCLASLVVVGTSINLLVVFEDERRELMELSNKDESQEGGEDFPWVSSDTLEHDNSRAAAFAIAFGLASTILSLGYILVHYNLIEFCVEGGWTELCCIVLTVLMWIVAVSFLTQDDGIGATIVGTGFREKAPPTVEQEDDIMEDDNNPMSMAVEAVMEAVEDGVDQICFLTVQNVTNVTFNCSELLDFLSMDEDDEAKPPTTTSPATTATAIPGSNLYLSVWTCLLGSLNLASRWKAQQALQFAQAQQENAMKSAQMIRGRAGDEVTGEEDDDDYDDLEDFEDADDY